ncbi:MAG: hypothetical protein M0Q88_05130 [Bacilli bacterium]|nr:hypothetical protein [Bacilli bacterium]
MDALEKREYYIILFDLYEAILTDKQRIYFKEYYFNDLSLSEIGTNYDISRSAVFDQINKVHQLLDKYENSLKLYSKYMKRLEILNEYSNCDNDTVKEIIEKLKGIE